MLISTLAAGHAKTVSTLSIPCQEMSFNLRNIKTRRYNFFAVTSQLPKQTEVRYFLKIKTQAWPPGHFGIERIFQSPSSIRLGRRPLKPLRRVQIPLVTPNDFKGLHRLFVYRAFLVTRLWLQNASWWVRSWGILLFNSSFAACPILFPPRASTIISWSL